MSNKLKGLTRVIYVQNDAGDAFELIGGAVDVNVSYSQNSQPSRTQSGVGNFNESSAVGFKGLTISVTGLRDLTTGTVGTDTLAPVDRMLEIFESETAECVIKIENIATSGELTANVMITSYESDGPQEGLVTESFTMEIQTVYSRTGTF